MKMLSKVRGTAQHAAAPVESATDADAPAAVSDSAPEEVRTRVFRLWVLRKDGAGQNGGAALPAREPAATFAPLSTGTKRGYLDKYGWYEPTPNPIASTTRQAEALRLAVARRAGTEESLIRGVDLDTGEIIYTDPGSDYLMADGSHATTVIRLGGLGEGKTAEMTCSGIIRALLLGRLASVTDKKRGANSELGEYTRLCEWLGVQPLRFATDGTGARINALDPAISMIGSDIKGTGQLGLCRSILHEALRRPLLPVEGKALRAALITAREQRDAVGKLADIRHLIKPLYHPQSDGDVRAAELRRWGLDMATALEQCVEEDLAGLIDGPTDARVELTSSLTSFDISALPDHGPALAITMAIISTWSAAQMRHRTSQQLVHSLTDEAWWLTKASFGGIAQRNIKLSRANGMINEFAFHHLADIETSSPAMSIIKEAGTALIYKQDKEEDAEACAQEFSLSPAEKQRLKTLMPGSYCLWQSNRPLRWVQHVRGEIEQSLTGTDAAFEEAAAGGGADTQEQAS